MSPLQWPHLLLLVLFPIAGLSNFYDIPKRDDPGPPLNGTAVSGWRASPDGRGTIDIIWSCTVTIFLCSWSVLCVNLPAESDSPVKITWRKFCLTGLGILGPEFVTQIALGQWISAKRSVRGFGDLGFSANDWSMTQAMFADMGGFILHTPDWIPFPINSKQLLYLVERGYVPLPSTSKREIKDKNKVDALLRIITILQTLWFVVNCLARFAQNLAITTFELTTLGFIYCTLGTHVCWAHKPADVEVPVVLYCKTPLAKILQEAGDLSKGSYNWTPLDFVSRQEWSFSLFWILMENVLSKMHIHLRPKVRPIQRMPNDTWFIIPPAGVYALGCVDMIYGAIYVAGWNFYFSTDTERILWHISTATIFSVIVMYLVIETYTFYVFPKLPARFRAFLEHKQRAGEGSAGDQIKLVNWIRNSSPLKDPQSYTPLKAVIPITFIGLLYCLARGYILLECILALRELPDSAYETINWSAFLPHI